MTLPPHPVCAQTGESARWRSDSHQPRRYPPPVHRQGDDSPTIAWREELGRLAGAVRRDRPRDRSAGARRVRQEPGDLRLPRRGRHRPRALRTRDRRRTTARALDRSVSRSAGGRRGGGPSCTVRRWDCSSGSRRCRSSRAPRGRSPVAVAAVAALVGWVLTVRARGFRMWSQLLAGLSVMALVAFLAMSPASDLVTDRDFDPVAAQGGASSVVLIVLDELPTASIIDASGAIDAARFPNLARLAGQATWYRNHTTQAGSPPMRCRRSSPATPLTRRRIRSSPITPTTSSGCSPARTTWWCRSP